MNRMLPLAMLLGILFGVFPGCDEDERAKQNQASRELVEADAKARGEMIALQRELDQGQADLGRQRDQLESDRRQYAQQRNRDPILANTILDVGVILACLLPLILGIAVVRSLRDRTQTDSALAEILVEEIVSDQPLFLPNTSRQAALGREPAEEGLPELPRMDAA